jgi:hypothetical protein
MKTKKLLFGLIEMNLILYNILYTCLCIVVLLLLGLGLAMLVNNFSEANDYKYYDLICALTGAFVLYFVGRSLMSKINHY